MFRRKRSYLPVIQTPATFTSYTHITLYNPLSSFYLSLPSSRSPPQLSPFIIHPSIHPLMFIMYTSIYVLVLTVTHPLDPWRYGCIHRGICLQECYSLVKEQASVKAITTNVLLLRRTC